MDDEIEDIIGEVKYTDSQKSVATTNMPSLTYSPDFTDSSPERNNSSGKETYVIEWDSDDEPNFPLRDSKSVINLQEQQSRKNTEKTSSKSQNRTAKSETMSFQSSNAQEPIESDNTYPSLRSSIIAQEIFTQTSKTIFELAANEGYVGPDRNTLETQTSFISITENKTVEYRIEYSRTEGNDVQCEVAADSNMCGDTVVQKKPVYFNIMCNRFTESLDDGSSKFPFSETEIEDNKSDISSTDQIIQIINDESRDNILTENSDNRSQSRSSLDLESPSLSDMEEDSLMVPTNSTASNKEIQELHEKLNESVDLSRERYGEPDSRRFGTLTPLTEESNYRRESLMDITPLDNLTCNNTKEDEVVFTNNAGMTVKLLKDEEDFKLPPIQNQSCPCSPQLNSLFSNKLNKLYKAGTLPCLHERSREGAVDRWEIGTKNLASGESALINAGNAAPHHKPARHLQNSKPLQPTKPLFPPIHTECTISTMSSRTERTDPSPRPATIPSAPAQKPISIKEKIKELKITSERKTWANATKYNSVSRADSRSRSASPSNISTTDEQHRLSEIAEKGCDVLVGEMMRRLRSACWFDIVETLEETPRVMEKFWGVISEHKTADLLRLMNGLVESPRPQVARAACAALATVIKNTNYTKKPEFYESMSVLLAKTGSYSRALRRAANMALDEAVCALHYAPAVCALCLHGAGHKSPLVRCASARLLVVCSALAGGGRALLRNSPTSGAAARRLVLRAMARLLDDTTSDTRKYAERLYTMLRPLNDFEAYYLTDVDVETAARQMKKYDQILSAPKEVR